MLSVSGPTKTGKTVLLRSVIPEGIWVSGGTVRTPEDFWASVASALGAFTDEEFVHGSEDRHTRSAGGEGGFAPFGKATVLATKAGATQSAQHLSRSRSEMTAARTALNAYKRPLIVDDFHYIPAATQL